MAWPQERPALPDPADVVGRRRAPHRPATPATAPVAADRRPEQEVELAWSVYQRLRSIYHAATPTAGRTIAEQLLETLHTCPVPQVAGLGWTLRQGRTQILAYFSTGAVSNGGTEAVNVVTDRTRRLPHGFRNFTDYYRLRILLAADGTRPYRTRPTHA